MFYCSRYLEISSLVVTLSLIEGLGMTSLSSYSFSALAFFFSILRRSSAAFKRISWALTLSFSGYVMDPNSRRA